MNVSKYIKGSVIELRIEDYYREYEIDIDTDTNKIMTIRSNNYNYPCNGGDNRGSHEEVFIDGLNIKLKRNEPYDGEFGAKEKIENGLKEFFSQDKSIDIEEKVLCSLLFKEITNSSIPTDKIQEEKY